MNRNIVCLYLAAGNSTRMGCNKLALDLEGIPLGTWALRAALNSHLNHVILVVSPKQDMSWLDAAADNPKCIRTVSSNAPSGQAFSLHTGIETAQALNAVATIVLLADQPFVTVDVIHQMIDTYEKESELDYIAAADGDGAKPPILFSQRMFAELLQLQGDEGARRLLRGSSPWKGKLLAEQNPRLFYDTDTKTDYERVKQAAQTAKEEGFSWRSMSLLDS
jgi:molybdenum cofactor cytidylyltransferase